MAYENKIAIESCIKRIHEQQGTTEKVQQIINELETVYRKAKAFDEITKLEKQTSLYSVVGKEDVELGIEIRKIINKYNDRYKESADDERS